MNKLKDSYPFWGTSNHHHPSHMYKDNRYQGPNAEFEKHVTIITKRIRDDVCMPFHLSSLNRCSAIVPISNMMIWCHLKLLFYWISIKFYISYLRSRIIMPNTSSFEFIPVSVSFWFFQFTIQWMSWQIHVIGLNHMDWWLWICVCVCSAESSKSERTMRKNSGNHKGDNRQRKKVRRKESRVDGLINARTLQYHLWWLSHSFESIQSHIADTKWLTSKLIRML